MTTESIEFESSNSLGVTEYGMKVSLDLVLDFPGISVTKNLSTLKHVDDQMDLNN